MGMICASSFNSFHVIFIALCPFVCFIVYWLLAVPDFSVKKIIYLVRAYMLFSSFRCAFLAHSKDQMYFGVFLFVEGCFSIGLRVMIYLKNEGKSVKMGSDEHPLCGSY